MNNTIQDEKKLSFLHIRDLPTEYKNAWVHQARKENMKLTDWATKVLNEACKKAAD